MKNLYIYLFFLLLATSGFSQNYHPLIKPNKYWDVMLYDNSICGYGGGGRSFFDGSDTIINTQTYQIIKGYPIISLNQGPYCPPFAVDSSIVGTNNYYFIREDTIAQKVYIFETQSNTEDLLYDFTLTVGDTLQSQYAGMGMQLVVVYVSTDTLLSGDARKIIYLNNGEYYIESIGGSKGGFFLPIVMGIGFDYLTDCVMENGIIIYGGACTPFVGINEFEKADLFRIFPNPSTGIFSIDVKKMGNIEVSVFNLLGELIYFNQENQSSQIKIDLSKETPGFYFAKIKSGNEFYTSKIIKQ